MLSKNSKKSKSNKCSCHKTRDGIPQICELPNICSLTNVIYECEIIETSGASQGQSESYVGLTKGRFIARKRQHDKSFLERRSHTATALSEHVHDLKEGNVDYKLEWRILQRARGFDGINGCNLCEAEKSRIMFSEKPLLNQRSELFNACCHRRLYKFKPPDEPLSSATLTLAE